MSASSLEADACLAFAVEAEADETARKPVATAKAAERDADFIDV